MPMLVSVHIDIPQTMSAITRSNNSATAVTWANVPVILWALAFDGSSYSRSFRSTLPTIHRLKLYKMQRIVSVIIRVLFPVRQLLPGTFPQ